MLVMISYLIKYKMMKFVDETKKFYLWIILFLKMKCKVYFLFFNFKKVDTTKRIDISSNH